MKVSQFLLGGLLLAATGLANSEEQPGVGYSSYEAALDALRSDPAVVLIEDQGWIIGENGRDKVLWSLTTEAHPAHPAVVKRAIVSDAGKVFIDMAVLCKASKEECDSLVQQFSELNQAMMEGMNGGS